MPTFPFRKIDAFATPASGGNPAGVVRLESLADISEAQMLRIARELHGFVSETAFIARIAPDAFQVRYFASGGEVQFCGHATIAAMYDLVAGDPALAALPRLLLHTNKGILPVENRLRAEDAVYIHAPLPVHTECRVGAAEIAQALGLEGEALDPALPPAIVNAGNQTLCVAVRRVGDVVAARPGFDPVLELCRRHALDVVALFSLDVADPANRLRSRVFAAPFGYLEDPATGSGNAALGYHLHRTGHWDGGPIRIEQNADLERPNIVRLASVADPAEGFRTVFGGGAITRIEGHYRL
jgi:PhzF family phenazine biosynthesis protein